MRRVAPALGSALLALVAGSPVAGAAQGGRAVFATPYLCERSGSYSAVQCRNAFANARAELEEASPRFPTRAACEAYFRRCAILDIVSSRKVTFGPAMEGVEISARAALPSVQAKGPQPSFHARPIDFARTDQSQARRKQAQAAWDALVKAAEAPPPSGPGQAVLPPEVSEPYDPAWKEEKGVATYPARKR